MTRKLYYFDVKGLGEGIRYLLHYGGLEFEDVRISRAEYPNIKESLNLPYGMLPMYVEDGKVFHQSQVIARYIARQLNLVPTDPLEEAKIDSILHTILDLLTDTKALRSASDPGKKEELTKVLYESVEYKFTRFEKHLAENNGHFGDKLYWVDILFVGFVSSTEDHVKFPFDKYPNIKALFSEVQSLRGIKEYLEERKALEQS